MLGHCRFAIRRRLLADYSKINVYICMGIKAIDRIVLVATARYLTIFTRGNRKIEKLVYTGPTCEWRVLGCSPS